MKKLLLWSLILTGLTACEVYTVEPVVPYDDRDRVIGWYGMDEYSKTYNNYLNYNVHISKATNSGQLIYISNFYNVNIEIVAYVSGYKIAIPYQVVAGYEIEGVGTISGGNIDFTYRIRDTYNDAYFDYCDAAARQTY